MRRAVWSVVLVVGALAWLFCGVFQATCFAKETGLDLSGASPRVQRIRKIEEKWRKSVCKRSPGERKRLEEDPLNWYMDKFVMFWADSFSLEEYMQALWDRMGKPTPEDLEKQAARLERRAETEAPDPSRDILARSRKGAYQAVAKRLRALAKKLRKPPSDRIVTQGASMRRMMEKRVERWIAAAKAADKELKAARADLAKVDKETQKLIDKEQDAAYWERVTRQKLAAAKKNLDEKGDKASYDEFKKYEKLYDKWKKDLAEAKRKAVEARKRFEKAKKRVHDAEDDLTTAKEQLRRAWFERNKFRRDEAVDGLRKLTHAGKKTAPSEKPDERDEILDRHRRLRELAHLGKKPAPSKKPGEGLTIGAEYGHIDLGLDDGVEAPTGKPVYDRDGALIGWVSKDKNTGQSSFEPIGAEGATRPEPQPVDVGPDGTVTFGGQPIGRILETPKKQPKQPTFSPEDGLRFSFVPSGDNYGDIGDILITNTTDAPVSVTVPAGLLLDSGVSGVQDLYVADVPTRTPCGGAKQIGKPVTVGPEETIVIDDVPGFCPDFELDPPGEGAVDVYAVRPPDEKADVLLAAIEAVKEFDVDTLALEVFEEDQTRQMLAQGALWLVESRYDDVPGNEVTEQKLADRFWTTFETSAGDSLAQMPADERAQAKELVKNDIKSIVNGISFVSKQ